MIATREASRRSHAYGRGSTDTQWGHVCEVARRAHNELGFLVHTTIASPA